MVIGHLLLVVGCWLLVVGYWLLVIGCWLLVVGHLLLIGNTGTGNKFFFSQLVIGNFSPLLPLFPLFHDCRLPITDCPQKTL